MTKQQSQGKVHVAAMRLILAAMERREGPPDWTIWQHMLTMLETIFQGIEDQRRDDQDELFFTRGNLEAKQAEMLGAVGFLRQERDHWWQARQDAIEAGELMKAEIETLRKQLANAQREASDEFIERQVLTAEQQEGEAAWRQQLDAAQAEAVKLRTLNDALVEKDQRLRSDHARLGRLVDGRCQELERLRAFVEKTRQTISRTMTFCDVEFLLAALAELDAGTTQPAPVTEPVFCPESERLQAFVAKGWGARDNYKWPDELDAGTIQPTPVAEPIDAEGGA